MIRSAIIFMVTFALGVLVAVIVRTTSHQPYAQPAAAPVATTSASGTSGGATPKMNTVLDDASTMQTATVNTICPICGMPVQPALGTALYRDQRIGFGCKTCPAQFAEDPEKYGPSALKNAVAE